MNNSQSIQTFRRILAELADMAEHASLTGSLRGGEKQAAQTYNRALETLVREDVVPAGLFETIDPETAEYGPIGVQCRLLTSAIPGNNRREEEDNRREGGFGDVIALAPFLKSQDLANLVRDRVGQSNDLPRGLLVGLAPFLDSEILGDLVRRQINIPTPPKPEPPVTPQPPTTPQPPFTPTPPQDLLPAIPTEHHPETLESLAAQLREPNLPQETRQKIATRLAELAYEQATQALE